MKKIYRQFRYPFTGRLRIWSALSISMLVFFLLQTTGALALTLPHNASPNANVIYYACVNYNTGKIYVIQQNGKCKSGFTMIQWNQMGPQGSQGPQGPQGPQGQQGPQGPAGISVGLSAYNATVHLAAYPGTEITQTAPVTVSGTYYVDATALLVIDGGDSGAFCYVISASNSFTYGVFGGSSNTGWQQASMSEGRAVNAGDVIELWCYSNGGDQNTYVYDGELNAFLINSPASDSMGKQLPPPTVKH